MHVSNTGAILRITKVAATALVAASAGFGATYPYRVGAEYSILLGLLTVLFAVALELIKPLTIAASFYAFASWSIGKGLALALLGAVAVAYSLVAELSLVSMSRADLASHRSNLARAATIQADRIDSARNELGAMPSLAPLTSCLP